MATEISNGKKTVKLYTSKNRGKTMFQLSYYEGGRRVLKNFSDKAEAKRAARAIVGDLTLDARAVDNLSTSELESYVAARKVLTPNYALHVAVAEHAQALAILGKANLLEAVQYYCKNHRSEITKIPLPALCDRYIESLIQSGQTSKHIKKCRHDLGRLKTAFPRETVSDLATEKLDQWLGSVTALGPVSKNYSIKTYTAFGNWAEKRGHLLKGSNPFGGMLRYKEPKEPVGIYSPEQMNQILQMMPEKCLPYVALGAFAGVRAAELLRLDWSDVDLEKGYVTVAASKAKTRCRRLVPISDNLRLWLLPYKKEFGTICPLSSTQTIARFHAKGIKWVKNGLRHSFISYRLAVIHDTARVALEAGNSSEIIFGHYRELVTPEAAQAWFKISPQAT